MTARKKMNTMAHTACITAVWCSPSACSTKEQPGGSGALPQAGAPAGRPDRVVGKKMTPSTATPAIRLAQKSTVTSSPAIYVASRKPMTHKPPTKMSCIDVW